MPYLPDPRLTVKKSGVAVGIQPGLNLIAGAGVTLTMSDDAANGDVDVTIASSGTGGSAGLALIDELDLTSTQTFSSIPSGHADLLLVVVGRATDVAVAVGIGLIANGDTASNYFTQRFDANGGGGSGVESVAATSAFIGAVSAANSPAGAAGTMIVDLPGYAGTDFWKEIVGKGSEIQGGGAGSKYLRNFGTTWKDTSAITSLQLTGPAGWASGSRASLYGYQ